MFFHRNNKVRSQQLNLYREDQIRRMQKDITGVSEEQLAKTGFGSVQELRKFMMESYERIAPLANANMSVHMQNSGNSTILQGRSVGKPVNKIKENKEDKRKTYYNLSKSLVDAFENKKRSSHDMMLLAVDANAEFTYAFNQHVKSSATTFAESKRAFNHLLKNKDGIIAFDLETFGGKNKYGRQEIDRITEFSFLYYDDTQAKSESKSIRGFVGLHNKDEIKKYEKMLHKFDQDPRSLTMMEEITLKSFAKLGSGGLKVEPDKEAKGRFTVEGGTDERHVVLNKKNISQGIKESARIGAIQAANLTSNGLMQWEEDLANAVLDMQKTKRSILGHNIIDADLPWMSQMLAKSSDTMQNYILGNGGSLSFSGIGKHRIADTLPLMRHAMANESFRQSYLTPELRKILNDYNLAPNTLEALSLREAGSEAVQERMGSGSNASHTSLFDAQTSFGLINQKLGEEGLLQSAIKAGGEVNKQEDSVYGKIKGDRNQYFYATRGLGGNKDGLMGFKVDPFSGQYYTMDGYTIDPGNKKSKRGPELNVKHNNGFNEFLTKKGMVYSVDGILELGTIDHGADDHLSSYIRAMQKINPALAVNDLYAVKFSGVTEFEGKQVLGGTASMAPKLDGVSYIMGTKNEISRWLNNDMLMIAEKNKQGKFELNQTAAKLLKGNYINEVQEGIEIAGDLIKHPDKVLKDIIKRGNKTFIDDTAGRKLREMNFNDYKAFHSFSTKIEQEAQLLDEKIPIDQRRKEVIKDALKKAQETAGRVAKGESIKLDDPKSDIGFVYELLANDRKGEINLHPGRISNAVAMTDYFREMSPLLEKIFAQVEDKTEEKNTAEKNYVFRQAMDAAIHNIEEFNKKPFDSKAPKIRQIDMDYFELPVYKSGERGTQMGQLSSGASKTPLRINLRGGEYDLLNKVTGLKTDNKGSKADGIQTEQRKGLYLLIDDIHEKIANGDFGKDLEGFDLKGRVFGDSDDNKVAREYMHNSPVSVIAKDFIEQLKNMRTITPTAGYLTTPTAQTVTGLPDIKKAMTNGLDLKNPVAQSANAIKNHKKGSILDITGISENTTALNKQADDIVQNILMDNFNADDFRNRGFSEQQVQWMARAREVRETDYKNLIKGILSGVGATNIPLHFDRGTGMLSLQHEGRTINLSDLPRERIVDGVIYTQVGRNRVATETILDVDISKNMSEITGTNLSFSSAIGKATDEAWTLEQSVINANKRGVDPINTIEGYIGKIAEKLREGSDIDRLDEADAKHGFLFDEKKFVESLKYVPNIENAKIGFDADVPDSREAKIAQTEWNYFLSNIKRGDFDYTKMSDGMKSVYNKHRRAIMRHAFTEINASDDMFELIDKLSNRAKSSTVSDGYVRVDAPQHEVESLNNPNRMFETSSKYLGFREDKALKRMEELDDKGRLLNKVYLGSNMRTEVGQNYTRRKVESLNSTIHTDITVKRAYTDAEAFKRRIYEAGIKSGKAEDIWASERLREIGNLYEGGGVASSRLGDVMLQSYDRQRISASRILFDEMSFAVENLEEMKKVKEVAPIVKVDKKGKVTFEYGKGYFQERGETLLTERAYGNSLNEIANKNEGFLKQGFFSKAYGILADEEEVRENVMRYAMNRKLEVKDSNAFLGIASEIYDNRFYVDRLEISPFQKIHEDRSEKGMTSFAYTGLGKSVNIQDGKVVSGDEKIVKALEYAGLDKLKGKILDVPYFEKLASGEIEGTALAQLSSQKGLTDDLFSKSVLKAGFSSVKEFGEAITAERHYLSDFMQDQHGGALLITNTEDAKHKNIGRPIGMMVEEMFSHLTNENIGKGFDRDEAERLAANDLHQKVGHLFVGGDGEGAKVVNNRLALPQMDFHNFKSGVAYGKLKEEYSSMLQGKDINEVMEKFGTMEENGKQVQLGLGFSTVSLPEDHTSITGAVDMNMTIQSDGVKSLQKGFKVTDREMIFFGLNRVHEDFLQNSFKHLDRETFTNAYGHMLEKGEDGKLFDKDGNFKLKEGFERRAYLEPLKALVMSEQFAQNGDKLLLRRSEEGEMQVVKQARGEVGEAIRYNTLDRNTLSDEKRRLVYAAEGASRASGGDVSEKAAKLLYSIGSTQQAIEFNKGRVSEENLKSNGLFGFGDAGSTMKLSEIDFTSGGDKKYFDDGDGIANSIYSKDRIIDLSEIDSSILRKANVQGDKIAIGAIQTGTVGDNVMQQDVHKLLKDIKENNDRLTGAGTGKVSYLDEDYVRYENEIVDKLGVFDDNMANIVSKKKGLLKEVSEMRRGKSAIGKASLMTLEEGPQNDLDILKNVEIDGKSVLEHHKKGVLMDFSIVSEKFVERMGLFEEDYMRSVGVEDRTEMKNLLKQGVMTITHRNPTIYEKSIGPSMMILSDNLAGNEVISYAAGALARKEDADGDQTKIMLAEALNSEGKKVDVIEMMSGSKKIDDKAADGFNMYKSLLYRNATEINPYFAKTIKEDMQTVEKLEREHMTKADDIIAARTLSPEFVRPELRTLAPEEMRQSMYKDYLDVREHAAMNFDIEYGNKVEFDDDHEGFRKHMTRAVKELDGESFNYYNDYQGSKQFSVDYYLRDMSFISSQIGSSKQASAGELNLPLYRARKIREMAYEKLGDSGDRQNMRILDHILEASEEAFLTPKHNESKIIRNTLVVEEFNKAFRQATGFTRQGETAGTGALVDWFEKNLPGRYHEKKPLETIGTTIGDLSKEDRLGYYQKGADLIHDIFSKHKNIDRLNLYVGNLGQSINGMNADRLVDAFVDTGRTDTMMDVSMRALNETYGDDVVKRVHLTSHAEMMSPSSANLLEWKPPVADTMKETTKNVFESVKNFMTDKGITGKHLAFGALGLAGATMTLGFVGGNPAERSTTTAAADQSNFYQVPAMADQSMAAQPNNQGYMININATSPKGGEHAQQAIRQAMTAGYNSTNVNIAMNINNTGGNITDSTIERMIEGMI